MYEFRTPVQKIIREEDDVLLYIYNTMCSVRIVRETSKRGSYNRNSKYCILPYR